MEESTIEEAQDDQSIWLFSSKEPSSAGPDSKQIIAQILDPDDNFSSNVRHLTIVDWKSKEVGEEVLCNILENPKDLESFRFPEARLYVSNTSKGLATEGLYDMSMDIDLLSSPQLSSLKLGVLCQNPAPATTFATATGISEFPILTRILLRGKKLRILRIACLADARFQLSDYQKQYARYGMASSGPFNLSLRRGDRLPALEELTFLPDSNEFSRLVYELSRDHSLALKASLDLTKLKILNLGRSTAHVIFAEITGCVPNLKSLRFSIPNSFSTPPHQYSDEDIDDLNRLNAESLFSLPPSERNYKSSIVAVHTIT
ncbi:hypothetical protein VTL71DRAFT_15494 [Oculimacula yallundae]|uniref:Symbiotic receptor-like kinase n=1 Tax=Oculimacula yallundae TaxID=86028 RepID=A0ABR4CI29_9HELO